MYRKYKNNLAEAYFKIEPIKWHIVDEKNGVATLVSEKIIDVDFFAGHNNYHESPIRDRINSFFLNYAFIDEEKELILTTMVDNTAESTGIKNNPNSCNCYSEDKIFLLSYKEAFESYGLTDKDRQKEPTDYTYFLSNEYCDDEWWLRSASDDKDYVQTVCEGQLVASSITEYYYGLEGLCSSSVGIVPALRIQLKD